MHKCILKNKLFIIVCERDSLVFVRLNVFRLQMMKNGGEGGIVLGCLGIKKGERGLKSCTYVRDEYQFQGKVMFGVVDMLKLKIKVKGCEVIKCFI